uniref:DRBM domain-containing protein n=1 Tax=Arundo donax TaxID=35708 RepID=A0A0A9GAR0_ARUDO
MTLFVASVVFDGNTYTGEAGVNKKDAEQKAARAVIKSILATENTCMMGIIRSKENLITAIKSSRNNKDTAAPIKFTRHVAYTAYGTSYPFCIHRICYVITFSRSIVKCC